MYRMKLFVHTALLLICIVSVSGYGQLAREQIQLRGAQANEAFPTEYTPQDIRVAKKSSEVRLSWFNGYEEPRLQYNIYRHLLPIDLVTVADAALIDTIDARFGDNQYFDTVEVSGYYYYAVTPLIDEGENYYFAARSNATDQAIYISTDDIYKREVGEVAGIAVGVSEAFIGLSYRLPAPAVDVYILRSQMPINNRNDALRAERIFRNPPTANSFVDNSAYIDVDYYYAVLDADALDSKELTITITAGENTTIFPVRIDGADIAANARTRQRSATEFSRTSRQQESQLSLPLINSALIGEDVFEDVEVISSGRSAVRIAGRSSENSPIILPIDQQNTINADNSPIQTILHASFIPQLWEDSIERFSKIDQTYLSPHERARIAFYLGQAYFYITDYENAILNFVQAKQFYSKESDFWVDKSLHALSTIE